MPFLDNRHTNTSDGYQTAITVRLGSGCGAAELSRGPTGIRVARALLDR